MKHTLIFGLLLCAILPIEQAGAQFLQQGDKLVGTGPVRDALQGGSVAISGNGSTAIVGGARDNNFTGAAWVYTRSGNAWTQQTKLVASDADGNAFQGGSVSISGNGTTAVSIRIEWESGKLLLTVQDNGKGFDATKPSTGNGLQNLRRRSEQIGARLTVTSRSGGGVVVSLAAEIT